MMDDDDDELISGETADLGKFGALVAGLGAMTIVNEFSSLPRERRRETLLDLARLHAELNAKELEKIG